MANVKDHSENERIKAVMIESGITDQDVWIGGNDLKQEGTFEWSDGSVFNFTNWKDEEPNDFLGDEDCVTILGATFNKTWNDLSCTNKNLFICKH